MNGMALSNNMSSFMQPSSAKTSATHNQRTRAGRYVVWVSSVHPEKTLDAATWLETAVHLRTLGWRVSLICEGEQHQRAVRGIEIDCLPRPQLYFWGRLIYHLSILKFLWQRWSTIDILFFHQQSGPWLLPLRLLRWFTRRPRPLLIMDTRDIDDPHVGKVKVQLRLWLHHKIFALANWLADGQTTITPRMVTLIDMPAQQLLGVWPSGVNPTLFAQAQNLRRWPRDGEPIHLIYLGILIPKRNLLPLCQAVVRANQAGMAFLFSLYGDGIEREPLAAFAAQTQGAIRVLPPVPHTQAPYVLSEAQVGVTSLPQRDNPKYEASSPIKLFEYLAAGLPILATRNACHTDVIGNGAYAFWADDATVSDLLAALEQVWQQRHRLQELGREAAVAAQAWSWQAAAQKLSAAFECGLARSEGE